MHRISDIRTLLNGHWECSVFATSSVPLARHYESENPAGRRNLYYRFDHDVSAFLLAIDQGFVLSLYKPDTTRMVGRLDNSTAIHTSLFFLTEVSLHIYTNTACISFIPPHIPIQPASQVSPHIYLHSMLIIYPATYT